MEYKNITEDIEFSLKNIAKGRKLGWAVDAKVYDEQPLGFIQSWKQRTRWTVGHIQCIKEYTKPLTMAVKENKTIMNFDRTIVYFRKYTNVYINTSSTIN